MQKLPVVAVVGRPNVGKSSLFNVLAGKSISIVDDESGVTRDRVYADVEWCGRKFIFIDTGGIDFDESNMWGRHIREQVDIALEISDAVVFVVDGTAGLLNADNEIAGLLRRSKKPIVLAVNKIDNTQRQANAFEFYNLRLGDPIDISCTAKRGIGDLLDAVSAAVPEQGIQIENDESDGVPRIAIVGRPNSGKSSIVNRLLGQKRVMVSEVAGTTRDSIDSPFRFEGLDFILTDTAGIRRKRSVETETVEHYSVLRALAAIRNSDVCVLVADAAQGLTEQDVRLAGYIDEMGKPSVICINKWDIAEQCEAYNLKFSNKNEFFIEYNKALKRDLAFMPYFKPVFISALTGQRTGEIMKAVTYVIDRAATRITTGTLNNLISGFVSVTPPPFVGGKKAKFFYSTQVSVNPPSFALFVNDRDAVPTTYLRYLENSLRKSVDLTGTPIRLMLRSRTREEK